MKRRLKKLYKECNKNILVRSLIESLIKIKSIDEIIKLIYTLKDCNYKNFAYYIAVNKDLIANRTTEGQIQLMYALKDCDYNENALGIAEYFIENRTIEEQIQLMYALKDCNYSNIAYNIMLELIPKINDTNKLIKTVMKKYKEMIVINDIQNKINNMVSVKEVMIYIKDLNNDIKEVKKPKEFIKMYTNKKQEENNKSKDS